MIDYELIRAHAKCILEEYDRNPQDPSQAPPKNQPTSQDIRDKGWEAFVESLDNDDTDEGTDLEPEHDRPASCFRPGEVVVLRSGGYGMVVDLVKDGRALCVWQDENGGGHAQNLSMQSIRLWTKEDKY